MTSLLSISPCMLKIVTTRTHPCLIPEFTKRNLDMPPLCFTVYRLISYPIIFVQIPLNIGITEWFVMHWIKCLAVGCKQPTTHNGSESKHNERVYCEITKGNHDSLGVCFLRISLRRMKANALLGMMSIIALEHLDDCNNPLSLFKEEKTHTLTSLMVNPPCL